MVKFTRHFALLIVFYICFIPGIVMAGGNPIDSLLKLLPTQQDTARVNMLDKLISLHVDQGKELDKALQYVNESFELASKLNYKKGIARAIENRGNYYSAANEHDKAIVEFNKALKMYEETDNKFKVTDVLDNIGISLMSQEKYDEALKTFTSSQLLSESIGNKAELLITYNYIATIYYYKQDYENALNYYVKTSKLSAELGNKSTNAKTLLNIGNIYLTQKNYDKAKIYYFDALKLNEELGYKSEIAKCMNNVGIVYEKIKEFDKALEFYEKSLKIKEELGDKKAIAKSLSNIGNVQTEKKNYDKALEYYSRSLTIYKELANKSGMSNTLLNIALLYNKKSKYQDALSYLNPGLEIAQGLKNREQIVNYYDGMASAYDGLKRYDEAYAYLKKQRELKDSIETENNAKDLAELQTKYDTEKKEKEIEALNHRQVLKDEQLKTQRIVNSAVGVGLLLVLVLAFYIYRGYRQKQKANLQLESINAELEKLSIVASETDNAVIIADAKGKIEWVNAGFTRLFGYTLDEFKAERGEWLAELSNNDEIGKLIEQPVIKDKHSIIYEAINTAKDGRQIWLQSTLTPIVDEATSRLRKIVVIDADITLQKLAEEELKHKNKDITDSINYARRIQSAILPTLDYVKRSLPHSFILYKPKDIVSGDFYYFTEKNHHLIIAAADCTGHGVPGALMSMIGHNNLNEIINLLNITTPADILNNLHRHVRRALKQDVEGVEIRDGMDIALCTISKTEDGKIQLQYAGANRPLYIVRNGQLEEVKADKFPIGGLETEYRKKYTNHQIDVQKTDTIYLFSDGYADQFGGEKKKKFMIKRLQQTLLDIHQLPLPEQRDVLDKTIEDWKQGLEQVDDILVIGVKFSLLGI